MTGAIGGHLVSDQLEGPAGLGREVCFRFDQEAVGMVPPRFGDAPVKLGGPLGGFVSDGVVVIALVRCGGAEVNDGAWYRPSSASKVEPTSSQKVLTGFSQ